MIAAWTLYKLALRQHLHGKRWIVMVVLFLLPPALALLVRHLSPDVSPLALEFAFAFMFIPQAILPLAALIYASGIIQDELEEQTITYLLIRPIPRGLIYLIKLLAAMTTAIVLTAVFTALTYAAIYAGGASGGEAMSRCMKAIAIHSLTVLCYCSLFGLMGLLTRRILVVGILYTVVVEGGLANLPFGIRLITVIYYARLIAYRTLPFVYPTPFGQMENIAADVFQLDVVADPKLVEHPTLQTCLAVLILASATFAAVGALVCSGREFYVKTPEK